MILRFGIQWDIPILIYDLSAPNDVIDYLTTTYTLFILVGSSQYLLIFLFLVKLFTSIMYRTNIKEILESPDVKPFVDELELLLNDENNENEKQKKNQMKKEKEQQDENKKQESKQNETKEQQDENEKSKNESKQQDSSDTSGNEKSSSKESADEYSKVLNMKLKVNNSHMHDYNYDNTNGDPYQNDVRLSEKISNEQKHDTPELTNKLNISDNKFEVKTPEECQKEYFAKQEEFPGICGRHGLTFMLDGYEPAKTQKSEDVVEKLNDDEENDKTEKTEELKENEIEEKKDEQKDDEPKGPQIGLMTFKNK